MKSAKKSESCRPPLLPVRAHDVFYDRFIDAVVAFLVPHRITQVKHMKGVDRKHFIVPPAMPAALRDLAVQAARKCVL